VDLRGVRVYSTGAVALNSEQLDRYEPGFGEGMTHGSLILHELGHLVGLGHTDAADSLMNPKIRQNGPGSFTSLDRANLAKVTLGRCPA
jgi:hypothetical protein